MGILAATGVIGGSSGSTGVRSMAGQETASYGSAVSASTVGSGSPSINAGGKGNAASTKPTDAVEGEGSVSEQVGKIIDEGQSGQADSRLKDGEGNPKKRMWDAEKEAAQEPQRRKDEL